MGVFFVLIDIQAKCVFPSALRLSVHPNIHQSGEEARRRNAARDGGAEGEKGRVTDKERQTFVLYTLVQCMFSLN